MAGCSTILIICTDDIHTQIIKGEYSLHAQHGEDMQNQAAKMIVNHACYNDIFEIQADTTGDFERTLAEAQQFKIALRKAMAKKPELKLMILGDNPTHWEAFKAHNIQIQSAILRKIKMVSEPMNPWPIVVLALLFLLIAALLLVLVATSVIALTWIAIEFSIGFMFLGTAILGISLGITSSRSF